MPAVRMKLKPGEQFDSGTRWLVESRSDSAISYLVELKAYLGNGCCQCMNFTTRMEPHLRARLTAEEVYQMNVIRQPKGWTQKPAKHHLRCDHILEARDAYIEWKLQGEPEGDEPF